MEQEEKDKWLPIWRSRVNQVANGTDNFAAGKGYAFSGLEVVVFTEGGINQLVSLNSPFVMVNGRLTLQS